MQLHCQNCQRDVSSTEMPGREVVCPSCGTVLSHTAVDGTVDWDSGVPPGGPIDGTIDMQTSPLDAEPLQFDGMSTSPDGSQPTNDRAGSTIDGTIDHVAGKTPSVADLERLEQTLEQFEAVWKGGGTPSISAFLSCDGNRDSLLVELTHLDLSYRLKARQDVRVEQYLEQYPELKCDRKTVIELILAEFRLRDKYGQRPTQASFAKRFPEFADELAVLLKQPPRSRRHRFPIRMNCPHCHNAIAVVDSEDDHEVFCPSCHSSFRIGADRTQSWAPESLPLVGRFQLLKMLGRGAFGTVYQARDTTLNRLVAMKIPRSGTFSSRADEDRFIAEAEHAAQLNHAGIVQVYDVGRTDEFPYIVTEFVRGVTLSDVLTARKYGVTQAARLVATIADALHHAHEHQVIHRDLKPANIMIDIDENPRVMDFGLAKRYVGEITVARDGSVLGTPAYMPPEQASGQSHSADRRSDVYSLGVMLFELLSGERPFRGNSVMLLRQVAQVEAPKLRSLNDKIPLDLETIAAKCLEKDREKRYQTAKELADDLRRHLNHEPIHARPIGRVERAARWCKRNPLLVKSAAAVFSTLVVALCIVSLFWRSESIQRRHASELADANRALYEQEQAARREAVVAKEHALQRLRDARGAADLWLTVFPQQLEELPGGPPVREKFLQQAAQDYERFAQQQSGDPNLELERGRSWLRLGDVRRLLAQDQAAFGAYQRAADVFAEIEAGENGKAEVACELATAWLGMGLALEDLGQYQAAEQHIGRTIAALTEHSRQHPDLPRLQEVLAASQLDLAVLRFRTGSIPQAQDAVARAIVGYQQLCHRWPEVSYRRGLASAESMQGELLAQSGDDKQARAVLERVMEQLDGLVSQDAENLELLRERAEKRVLLASVLRSLGDTAAELQAYEQSAADYQSIDRQRSGVPVIRQQLAVCLSDKGNLLQYLQRGHDATEPLIEAIVILNELVLAYGRPEYHEQVAASRAMLGEVYRDLGKYDESRQLLHSSLDTYAQLVAAKPEVLSYVERQAVTRGQLGQTLAASDHTEAAANELRTAIAEFDGLLDLASATPSYLNGAAYTNWNLGEALFSISPEAASAAFGHAIELWERIGIISSSPEYANSFAHFLVNCVDAKRRDAKRAIQLAERSIQAQPANTRYLTTLASACYQHGDLARCEKTLSPLVHDGRAQGAGQFFLAMTLAKQGQAVAARQQYDAGTAWLLEQQPGNRLLQRLQQEALTVIERPSAASP